MEKIEHKMVTVNALNMHVAELGEGPLVLFLHGFPQLWYTWRHQILFMAERGYRAVAPDLRGYGDTTGAPLEDPSKFTYLHVVGDLIELLEAIAPGGDKVFVVGHDWGAIIAWQLCLYRPDKVKALVNISVAFSRRNPVMKPVDALRSVYGDDYYMCRFQEPGEIEAEFAQIGAKEVVKNFLAYRTPGPLILPKGKEFGYSADRPSWLAEEELDYYASKFEKTGFTGGVNYYRAINLSWELGAPWLKAKVNLPVKFIVGEFDLVYHMPGVKEYVHNGRFKMDVPLLQEVVVVEGAAHFVVEERPDEISEHIYSFLKNF
ncbi:epoxide hydrolase 2-like [Primulina tabacum]|uniref:epoxide hydrolase 2-like n=1 Tax=Primulina tabacum TaxID=48773 RepID=UPI003F5A8AA5